MARTGDPAMKPRIHEIEGGGGAMLHVREFGPEDGQPILLLHGWSQMHHAWAKQTIGPLAERFRLICPDLRGHGASAKPADPAAYTNSDFWAEDVAAIIRVLDLHRPIVAAWSMAGWVLGDYLRVHDSAALGGIALIAALCRGGIHADKDLSATIKHDASGAALLSADQVKQLEGTFAFIKAAFAAPPSKRDAALIAGWTALTPVGARRACIQRDVDFRAEYAAVTCPALLISGEADRIVPPARALELSAHIPGTHLPETRILRYPGTGHMPFWERPERFNADLAAFAEICREEPAG